MASSLTPAEQRRVTESQDADLTANLFWSAEESARKVLETGLRRDTRSVEVRLGTEVVDGLSAAVPPHRWLQAPLSPGRSRHAT